MAEQQKLPAVPFAFRVRPDCAQLFIMYTGWEGQLMISPMLFIEQTNLLDRNLIMVRDLYDCCYQRGVARDLPDIPSFLEAQKKLLAEKFPHVRDLYCVGSSAGGYAALLSGHFLKARKVWAFAPPIPVLLHERTTYLDAHFADLSQVLAQNNGVTAYDVYYNESEEFDRSGAELLRKLPGVSLFPQTGKGHGVIRTLANQQKLADLLPPFVAC